MSPGKVKLIIHTTTEAGGKDPVPIGVNGRVMLVPRGKEVEIPHAYFEVLKNAKRFDYEPGPEGYGLQPPTEVQMYSFQRLS